MSRLAGKVSLKLQLAEQLDLNRELASVNAIHRRV